MKLKPIVIAALLVAVVGAGGYGLYHLGMQNGMKMSAPMGSAASGPKTQVDQNTDPATGRKVLYWHDPMVPGQK